MFFRVSRIQTDHDTPAQSLLYNTQYANDGVLIVVMFKWILKNIRPQHSFRVTRSTPRHPALSKRAHVPRPPHTSALGVPGDTTADGSQLGERGA